MDPKVYGKLLTHHRRGYGVDVEALCDRCPYGGAPEKAPRRDLTGTEGCGGGNRFSWCSSMFSGYESIYRQRRSVMGAMRGPRGWGRALPPWACPPASWLPCCVSDFIFMSSGLLSFQERSSRRFHSVWTPLVFLFYKTLK